MTAQPSGGTAPYSYLWSNGQTTQSVTVSNRLKSITVTVTDAHGCTGTKSFSPGQCLSKSAGIDDTEEQRIHVYPNPVSDFISVEFAEIPTNAVALSVLDMTGRVMIEVNGLSPDRNTYYINTENIPAGVYFVRIQSESGMWVNKIIKE